MYFPNGGGTLRGISKPGELVWSRIFIEGGALKADIGRAKAISLPAEETQRRWQATTVQWPIMHAVLYGVSRDQLMGKHQSNHIQAAEKVRQLSESQAVTPTLQRGINSLRHCSVGLLACDLTFSAPCKMWNPLWDGFPSEEFLISVDPLFKGIRAKIAGRFATSLEIAGHLTPEWAARLGLRAGIPIPVGAIDAHWDAIGAGARLGDMVNVVGTSTCIMAMSPRTDLIPGVCGVVPGSINPRLTGIEAGLSATGDIFDAIATRAGTTVAVLSNGLDNYRAGSTGLLRLNWDNGDRTVLTNPELGGVTFGWKLTSTAQDELFAAIESSGFHTRIVIERMEQYGVPVDRIINAGGIPQKNATLNRVYANILNKPVLVPERDVTSLGSAIFAFLAAGTFKTVEKAQAALSPGYKMIEPESADAAIYARMYPLFRKLYFELGESNPALPTLRTIAAGVI
jgi:L-ribulokinase